LPIVKRCEFVPQQPCVVKTSNIMKLSVTGEKKLAPEFFAERFGIRSRPLRA